jgi:thiol-disulfide isomerase/thioredoxin
MMRRIHLFFLLGLYCSIAFKTSAQKFLEADSTDIWPVIFPKSQEKNLVSLKNADSLLVSYQGKFAIYFDKNTWYSKIYKESLDGIEMELFELKAQQNAFLSSQTSADPTTISFLKSEASFSYWHYLYAYPILRGNRDQKLKTVSALPKVMTKNFPLSELKKEENIHSAHYRKLLYYYVSYLNSEQRAYQKYSDPLQAVVDKSEFAIKNLSKNGKDYIIAQLLQTNQRQLKVNTVQYLLSQIDHEQVRAHFKGAYLDTVAAVEARAKDKEILAERAKTATDELKNLEGKATGLEKYKGKVLYVDIWASWCGPCRAEFPHSINMKNSLTEEEKKKIAFLNISIDDSEEAWKKAIESLGLKEFEHAISPGGWSSKLVQKYKIRGIPRYMIFDKTGKLVQTEASRPSNPETLMKLRELIN